MKNVKRISGLACVLLLLSGVAQGAGLGKLSIQSALGQPLRAEIELLSVSKDELPGVTAKLANLDAFRQARIDRTEAIGNLRFSVEQRANGQPVVRVTSGTPINDPFLDMLIELNWSSGRIIREYTLLLDPPGDARHVEAAVMPVAEVPRAAAETRKAAPAEVPAAKPAPVPAPTKADRYGPVKAGETLRSIVGHLRTGELSTEQMMVALYQANKGAFFSDNMNNLKKGATLNVPTADSVAATARPNAQRTVREHTEAWHAYRSKVAEQAGEASVPKAAERPAAGKIAPKGEDKAAPAPAAAKDVLKLSKGEPAANARPDVKLLEKQRAMEEELSAKSRSLQEAQSRVSQLEKTVGDLQKLMDLKAKEAAKAAAVPPPAPVKPVAPAAVQPPAPAPVVEAPKPAPVVEAPKPAPSAAAQVKAPVLAQAAEPAKPSKSWLSTFITDPLYIGGLIAAGLLSGLLWMMMNGSRRRQGLNKFEDSIMTGGEFKNASVFNAPAGAGAGGTTGGSMLLTDFSRLGLGAIDTHEVDPIAEAEVYMAYGRDAQAEEILKEALIKDPGRHEIALKLLEIFAARKDTVAFETAGSELYASLGGQNTPVWQRAAEMGRSIDAANPLYRLSADELGVSAAAAVAAPSALEAPAEGAAAPASATADDLATVVAMSGEPIDLAGEIEPAAEEAPALAEASDTDQGMDFAAPDMSEFEAPAEPVMLAGGESEGIDFEPVMPSLSEHASEPEPEPVMVLDMPEEVVLDESDEVPEFAPIEAEPLPEVDLSGIDLDLKEDEIEPEAEPVSFSEAAPAEEGIDFEPEAEPAVPEFVPEFTPEPVTVVETIAEPAAPEDYSDEPANLWEEVNTKLDLARAYLEMGDKEGAREILQEVMGEGDANQKTEADKLLAEAG